MKPINSKVSGGPIGGGLGAVIAWVWGISFPTQPMPPEIAPIIGGLIAGIVSYYISNDEGTDALKENIKHLENVIERQNKATTQT